MAGVGGGVDVEVDVAVGVMVGVSVGKGVLVDVAVGVANKLVTELKLQAEDKANKIITRKASANFLVFIITYLFKETPLQ
jgi:hypothetical protein